MQPQFAYNVHIITTLQNSVSPMRLQRYEVLAAGDSARAFAFYMWNTALSEALYGPIQGLEITLRNRMSAGFTGIFGPCWYDARAMRLMNIQQDHVAHAKQSLQKQRKPLDPHRIVAELNFGFWVSLLGRRYENHLWRPHLRDLFVNAPHPFLRKEAHRAFDHVRLLRNRIAHHEPILHRPLLHEHASVIAAIRWLCPTTAAWVQHHSRFNSIYAERP